MTHVPSYFFYFFIYSRRVRLYIWVRSTEHVALADGCPLCRSFSQSFYS